MSRRAGGIKRSLKLMGKAPHVFVVVLIVGLLAAMVIGPTKALLEQKHRLASMSGDLDKIERTNERISERIERLKDPDFIEQQARSQAGLVRPGEIPYVVMPPSKSQSAKKKAGRAARAARKPPPEPGVIASFVDFIGF